MRLERRSVGAANAVGLEIGSSAVRAAEVTRSRRGLGLRRFAEVPLAPGVVVDGEIREMGAVVVALRELWSKGGFSSRKVNLCLSGLRVIVRQAEVIAMSAGDFRSSLEFQAADLIPLPLDFAVLDFSILPAGEGIRTSPGKMRVLVAAAHREVIDRHMSALREASLTASAIDAAPIAAVRASRRAGVVGGSVGVVDLNDDLAVVAVSEVGAVRFSRIQGIASDISEAAAALPRSMAADRGFRGSNGSADLSGEEQVHGSPVLTEAPDQQQASSVVAKVVGSLSFFTTELDEGRLHEVVVTGRLAGNPELLAGLAGRISAPVRPLDALGGLDLSALELDVEDRLVASSVAALAIGAAEWSFEPAAQRLSLLPKEAAAAAAARRMLAAGGVVALAVVVGLGAVTYYQHRQVQAARQQVTTTATASRALESQIATLTPVSAAHAAIAARLATLGSAEADDVAWSTLLSEISAAMPPGATLSNISFQDASGGSGASSSTAASTASVNNTAGVATLGSVTMSVQAKGTEDQVAVWLRALDQVKGLTAVWVPSGAEALGTVTFSSTASLTKGAPMVVRGNIGTGASS